MMNIVESMRVVKDYINADKNIISKGITLEYMYGHLLEVNNRIKINTINNTGKYPALVLRLDTPEKVSGGFREFENLNIFIIDLTDKKYNAEQRYEKIFVPKLYPLYESFLSALSNVGIFTWAKPLSDDAAMPPHVKVDRYYWGTISAMQNIKSVFDDPIDAIEITNLNLKIRTTC